MLNHILTLAICALAVRLIADLTTLRLVPMFRCYLAALALGLISQGEYTPAWMGLAILVIKFAATIEMYYLLCKEIDVREWMYVWAYALGVGLITGYLVVDFQQQANLENAEMVYIRHVGQVALASIALAITLHAWANHQCRGFGARHRWLMTAQWFNYAAIGILSPDTLSYWRLLDASWSAVTILLLSGWLFTVHREGLRAAGCRQEAERADPSLCSSVDSPLHCRP